MLNCSSFYVIVSMLVIFGGIGFPILVNFRTWIVYRIRSIFKPNHRKKMQRIANLNTRIVITTTIILLLFGTVAIAVTEWHGAFSGLSWGDKVVHSFFYSAVSRTAGFNSSDLSLFSSSTMVVSGSCICHRCVPRGVAKALCRAHGSLLSSCCL